MLLFGQGLIAVFQPATLLLMVIGVAVGILFGALPGLTAVMAVALFLPVTYGMAPAVGLSLLISLYV